MKKESRPPQIDNLLAKVKDCIERGRYRQSLHAIDRLRQRGIELTDAIYVLKNGYHEKSKTTYDELNKTWKYAIRCKYEKKDIRVIVAFDANNMLIITVMHVAKI